MELDKLFLDALELPAMDKIDMAKQIDKTWIPD